MPAEDTSLFWPASWPQPKLRKRETFLTKRKTFRRRHRLVEFSLVWTRLVSDRMCRQARPSQVAPNETVRAERPRRQRLLVARSRALGFARARTRAWNKPKLVGALIKVYAPS